ncbi:MAG: FAD/NAD(P)-binding oxidoreductase [Methanolobus sp.]
MGFYNERKGTDIRSRLRRLSCSQYTGQEFRKKIAKDELEITILDKSDTNINQGGFTFIPFELYTPEDITRPRSKLISPRVNAFYGDDGEVTAVDLQTREVTVKSDKKYTYDYLVIAMGCRADVNAVPGLTDDLNTFYTSMEDAFKVRDLVKSLDGGKVVVSVASMPVPCPGAPVKFTFMLDSYLRNVKKIRDDVQLTLVWPMEPIGPPEFNKFVTSQFNEKGVEVVRNFPLDNVDAANKELTSKNGDKVKYDTLITVPPHKHHRF